MTTNLQSMVIVAKHSIYFQSTNQVPDSVDVPSDDTTVHHDHVYSVTSRITSNTSEVHLSTTIDRVLDAVLPTALDNVVQEYESSHTHPLDDSIFGGTLDKIDQHNQVSQVCYGSHSYGDLQDNFVVPAPGVDFANQYRFTMKPATQVALDYLGNVIKDFPFNMKAFTRTELGHLSKSTRRNALSLSHRVTSTTSGQGQQVIYKMSQSIEETSDVTSTTTMLPKTDMYGQETNSDTSFSSNGDYLEDETKSVSVVPDSVSEDDIDDISVDSQHSPVFGVKAPNSMSTEYPGDESVAFTAKGLVEVDHLGSSQTAGEWSDELFSDPDQLLERCDDMDVTKTCDDDNTVGTNNLPKEPGKVLFPVDKGDSVTFPEDDSPMDLEKTLVRSDDHDATIKQDSADVDLSKTAKKRTHSDAQHCPFKKRFKGLTGNEFTCHESGDGNGTVSDTNIVEKQSQAPDESAEHPVISLVKRHFIIQDLGVAEMMAEGDSKIHVHVHAKDDIKQLIQRLIVDIGENKGWEVHFQKVPIVQIPNIQHLLGNSQTSIVYTDIALDNNDIVENTEKIIDDMDASISNPMSVGTQVDIHVAVTNKDDVENNSDKTPVFGGEVRYSVHARVTKSPDFEDDIEKKPVGRGELITSERKQFSDVDNGDKEMGAHGDISEDAKSASVDKPMDVTSADEANDTHDGGKHENDSGTSDSDSDSESSDSNSSNSSSSGSSEYESGSENKSSGEFSKNSKLGSEKINVHDNETDACDITSEKKESAEVPVEEKDDDSVPDTADDGVPQHADDGVPQHADYGVPQHADDGVPDTADGGVPDTGDVDVSDPGDDLLLEKLMRETDQLEEQSPIPGAKVDRRSKHRHLATTSKI